MEFDVPKFNPHIAALPIHICQKMGYDWILSDIIPQQLPRNTVLDFGANGYPFLPVLVGYGAAGWWCDRDRKCEPAMAKMAKQHNIALPEYKLGGPERFNIVVASNAIQHNQEGALEIYQRLRDALADGGRLYVVEALGHGKSWWNDKRADPCWHRTLDDHAALWRGAALRLIRMGFFTYTYNADGAKEAAEWLSPVNGDLSQASRVCARLERVAC